MSTTRHLLAAAAMVIALASPAMAQTIGLREAQTLPDEVAHNAVVCFDYTPTGVNGTIGPMCAVHTSHEVRAYLMERDEAMAWGRPVSPPPPAVLDVLAFWHITKEMAQ